MMMMNFAISFKDNNLQIKINKRIQNQKNDHKNICLVYILIGVLLWRINED